MRIHIFRITAAIAIAALGVACSGRTNTVKMTEERAKSSVNERPNQRLELIGCVKPASTPGEGKFILDRVTPPPGAMTPEVSTTNAEPLIPRGSWVRLAGLDMHPYLGKEVAVSGDLVKTGLNTIGTAGQSATTQQAAQQKEYPSGAEANGETPEIAVETVKVQADSCTS